MTTWIGTSGYQYPEWKGSFYPAALPTARMLPYYAERFNTVEINYTFRRLPTEKVLLNWAASTPERFTFTLKAPERMTHTARLTGCEEILRTFCELAQVLGPKLGVLLFQLPPFFRKNLAVLDPFLAALPPRVRAAFEFRHPSWHDEEVFGRLRDRNLALCIADSEKLSAPVVATADYGYFRLRDEGYDAADIARWGAVIREQGAAWGDTFVYFKHEEQGKGPELARMLMRELGL
jgi:uncharacterized protein YecE (DUF72 family)